MASLDQPAHHGLHRTVALRGMSAGGRSDTECPRRVVRGTNGGRAMRDGILDADGSCAQSATVRTFGLAGVANPLSTVPPCRARCGMSTKKGDPKVYCEFNEDKSADHGEGV